MKHPVHRSLVAVDIEGYSRRDNPGHLQLRAALRQVLADAFDAVGVTIDPDERQDQGDAFLILVAPDVSKLLLVDGLVREIENALRQFNRYLVPEGRMRLRLAMHSGEVHLDGTGFPGAATVAVMRLLDSELLKQALKAAPKDLALIVSDSLYQAVVVHGYASIDPAEYQQVEVVVKEFRQPAWVRVPGRPATEIAREKGNEPASHGSASDTGGVERPAAGPPPQFGDNALTNARFQGPTSFGGPAAGRDITINKR